MWPLVALGAAIGTTIIGHFRTVNAIKKETEHNKWIERTNEQINIERFYDRERYVDSEGIAKAGQSMLSLSSPSIVNMMEYNRQETNKSLLRNAQMTMMKIRSLDAQKQSRIAQTWMKTISTGVRLSMMAWKLGAGQSKALQGQYHNPFAGVVGSGRNLFKTPFTDFKFKTTY